MEARYILNTDMCIYLRKRRPPSVEQHFQTLQRGEVVISVITYGELHNGALKSKESSAALANLQALCERLPIQGMAPEAAEHYGQIRSALEKSGNIIGGNDLWIAARAIALDLTLVTNNVKEFGRIPQLRLENWLGE